MNLAGSILSLLIPLSLIKPIHLDVTGTWTMHSITAQRWEKEVRLIQAGETVLGESWDRTSGVRGKIQAQVISGNQVVGIESLSTGQNVDFRWVANKTKFDGRMWQQESSQEVRAFRISESIPVFKYFDRVGTGR